MNGLQDRLRFPGRLTRMGGVGLWIVLGAAGCQPSNKVAAGAPELVSFDVIGPDGMPVALVTEAGAALVPPLSKFRAVFDRLLDPSTIEIFDPDGGVTPQSGVAMTTSTPKVHDPVTVAYTPNGDINFYPVFSPGPSLTVTPEGALPCGVSVTVELNPNKVRSHDQQTPFKPKDDSVKGTLTFATEPFAATLTIPKPDTGPDAGSVGTTVPTDSVATVQFNTLVPQEIAGSIHVTFDNPTGMPGKAIVMQDKVDSTLWKIAPPDTGWPVGTVKIDISADAADTYGTTLGTAVAGSFEVAQ